MTHDEMIACIQAHKEGKTVEILHKGGLIKNWNPIYKNYTQWDFSGFDYRIKPEPKKRLMTARELAGRWIRFGKNDDNCYFVYAAHGEKIRVDGSYYGIDEKLQFCDDIRNPEWKSVEVEE